LFTARLEKAGKGELEVLNAGVGGYGTVQEYLYMMSDGVAVRPDIVLLMFYENDLTDNGLSYYPGFGPRPYARITGNRLEIIENLDPTRFDAFILPMPFRTELNAHSYLYYFLNSRIYQPLLAKRLRELQQADLRSMPAEQRYELQF